jgi:peptidoglycan/xylan/chitin deacetylase (PgdA/CDA1 family)
MQAGTASGRRFAQHALKRAAAGADRLRRPSRGVVVLLYHRVGGHSAAPEIDLPAALFDEQCAEIAGRATSLDAALDALNCSLPPREDPVVVTFDDGTADFVDDALPILVRHGVPALLYVATAFVADGREFPGAGRPASWAALRDAVGTGLVTLGSHTHSHVLLDRCDAAQVADELDRSIDLIAEQTGQQATHFAYPKAVGGSAHARDAVRRRFRSAALAGTHANAYGATDPFRLARSPIQRSDGMRWFRQKVGGGMALEDDVRRVANRFRYAGATT